MSLELTSALQPSTDHYNDGGGPSGAHEGTRKGFLLRHERECSSYDQLSAADRSLLLTRLPGLITDTRNLILAAEHIARKGDKAPGPNGQRLADRWAWDRGWVYTELRQLSRAIQCGGYQPGPTRLVNILKASGNGTRPIEVMNWQDMAVQRAIIQIIRPITDPRLGPLCFGARPLKGRFEAMAHAKAISDRDGRGVVVVADLKDAFTAVPHQPLIEQIRSMLGRTAVADLIWTIMRANGRQRGLSQGAPLSSLLLDVYLNTQLDERWRKRNGHAPLIRWVDDILILCRTVGEAEEAHERLRLLLQPTGMQLKRGEGTGVRNLTAEDRAEWLGAGLAYGSEGMSFGYNPNAIERLNRRLRERMETTGGAASCYDALLACFQQLGPCFATADRECVIRQARNASVQAGADEPPSTKALQRAWAESSVRYTSTLSLVRALYGLEEGKECGTGKGSAACHANSSVDGRRALNETCTDVQAREATHRPTHRLVLQVIQQPSGIGCWATALTSLRGRRAQTIQVKSFAKGAPLALWRKALCAGLSRVPTNSVVELHGTPDALWSEFEPELNARPATRPRVSPRKVRASRWRRLIQSLRARSIRIVRVAPQVTQSPT